MMWDQNRKRRRAGEERKSTQSHPKPLSMRSKGRSGGGNQGHGLKQLIANGGTGLSHADLKREGEFVRPFLVPHLITTFTCPTPNAHEHLPRLCSAYAPHLPLHFPSLLSLSLCCPAATVPPLYSPVHLVPPSKRVIKPKKYRSMATRMRSLHGSIKKHSYLNPSGTVREVTAHKDRR